MDKKFVIKLQGKEFILFEGLLNAFHENGGNSIETNIISTDPFIIQATVSGDKGVYQGIGDADESNTNRMVSAHKYRMSETRAIARALRWYNNVGMCSLDELGGEDQNTEEDKPWFNEKELENFKNAIMQEKINPNTVNEAIDIIEKKYKISKSMKETIYKMFNN